MPLTPFYVVPGYTFFNAEFTIPKRHYSEYIEEFNLNPDNLQIPITIKVGNKNLPAKLRMAQINNKGKFEGRSDRKYTERKVLQISWANEYDTKKALRKMVGGGEMKTYSKMWRYHAMERPAERKPRKAQKSQ